MENVHNRNVVIKGCISYSRHGTFNHFHTSVGLHSSLRIMCLNWFQQTTNKKNKWRRRKQNIKEMDTFPLLRDETSSQKCQMKNTRSRKKTIPEVIGTKKSDSKNSWKEQCASRSLFVIFITTIFIFHLLSLSEWGKTLQLPGVAFSCLSEAFVIHFFFSFTKERFLI